MTSNLPPGVSDNMIPGNRPEDVAWENVHNLIDKDAESWDMSADNVLSAWSVGIKAWVTLVDSMRRQKGLEDALERPSRNEHEAALQTLRWATECYLGERIREDETTMKCADAIATVFGKPEPTDPITPQERRLLQSVQTFRAEAIQLIDRLRGNLQHNRHPASMRIAGEFLEKYREKAITYYECGGTDEIEGP